MSLYENITEIINVDQFHELFYTRKQRFIAYGIVWYFIREHNYIYISDYSFQDLLEIEDSDEEFIRDWLMYAISRIREIKLAETSAAANFVKFIKKITKGMPDYKYADEVAKALFERFLKMIQKTRVSHQLDVYSAVGRVLRNYFISKRLDFHKGNENRAYDYGEFLYEGGLKRIFEWIRKNRGCNLMVVDWRTTDSETGCYTYRLPRSLENVLETLEQKNIYKQLKSAVVSKDTKGSAKGPKCLQVVQEGDV